MKKSCFALLYLLALPNAWSAEKQNHAEIKRVTQEFIQAKSLNMPGKVSFMVGELDSRLALTPCSQLEAYLPTGAQLLGKTNIGVRCNEKNGWSLLVPASITITVNILVSSKPLQQGQEVRAGDFNIQSGELNQQSIITDETQALGKVLKFSIGAGQILKQEMLRPPYAVTQGQTVQLIYDKPGLSLRSEGKAMNNAADGQLAQVKTAAGQVITGTARPNGIVEIRQ
jgi:flagella basal body P-ring formation protein FlgA